MVGGKFVDPYLKITDFGNAIALGNIDLYYDKYEVQSLSYRAPEVSLHSFFHFDFFHIVLLFY